MKGVKEAINILLSLLLVMLIILLIYSFFVAQRLLNEPEENEPVITLDKKGNVIINGKQTDYTLEEIKVYRLRRINENKH